MTPCPPRPCVKVPEFRNDREWDRWSPQRFPELIDTGDGRVAKKLPALMNVCDAIRLEAHQTGTGCVSSYRVVGKHNTPEWSWSPVQRPISFHCHNGVSNDKVNRNRSTDVENALLNPLPVQQVFGPAIL